MLPRIFCLVDDRVDVALIADLVEAGVNGIQVRAKELPGRELLALTEADDRRGAAAPGPGRGQRPARCRAGGRRRRSPPRRYAISRYAMPAASRPSW